MNIKLLYNTGDKVLSEFEFICGAKSSPHILSLLEQNQIPGLSE